MTSSKYIAFHKPYGVVSQFSGEGNTLSDFNFPKGVYAAGRLDKDSEGLLILTNDGPFIKKITDPRTHKKKVYWVQVEGEPQEKDLTALKKGLVIKGKKTRPCEAKLLSSTLVDDQFEKRDPPVRFRKTIPTAWIEITLTEGMNRQVRKMCAAINFPCLRLIRVKIGNYSIGELPRGHWVEVEKGEILAT